MQKLNITYKSTKCGLSYLICQCKVQHIVMVVLHCTGHYHCQSMDIEHDDTNNLLIQAYIWLIYIIPRTLGCEYHT